MKQNCVIDLTAYLPEKSAPCLDYAAVNRRAQQRFRASQRRAGILTAVEGVVSICIGIGFVSCLLLFFTML